MRSVRAPFGPCPGEDGKSPGRTSPCGGAVYLSDRADIGFFRACARPRRNVKMGRSKRAPHLQPPLEVYRRREEHLARVAIVSRQDSRLAQRRDGVAGAVENVGAGVRVLQQEVVSSDDVLLVQEVLAVESELEAVAGRAPHEIRVPQ